MNFEQNVYLIKVTKGHFCFCKRLHIYKKVMVHVIYKIRFHIICAYQRIFKRIFKDFIQPGLV